jgi:carbonic anhydrase/acetyltransferase-like protein (isoleucine patch superfamily)
MKSPFLFHSDQVHASAFVAHNATVLGDVAIGQRSSIWFGAVVRGDTERIEIGDETNVQDLSVLHADPDFPCRLGKRVTVGHAAIVHGAIVEDDVMIGMRAVVLNGAKIGSHSIIAAGCVVPEGMLVPPGSLVMGVPGRIKREITDSDKERISHAADHYAKQGQLFRENVEA